MFVWPNFQLGFLSSGVLHCWLINELCGLSFTKVGWLGFGLLQGTCCIILVSSPSSELIIKYHFFIWIPYSSRNLLVKFKNFSQSIVLVGKRFNRFYQAVLFYKHIVLFWLVLSHPSSELSPILFLNSLFFEEFSGKFLEIFSVGWTSWESFQQVLLDSPIL